jgi:cell wall-associated NlpC family hydrolase
MSPVASDPAISARWRKRLALRRNLLEDALEDLHAAKTPAERADANARVQLRHEQIADAKAVLARHRVPKLTARERAVRAAMIGYRHRDAINYTQDAVRRWEGISKGLRAGKGQFPSNADCSSFVTWCLWDALGGPDAGADIVNGAKWTAGYTGTQCGHGHEVSINRAQPGDLAFYGPSRNNINHVTIVVAPGRVISHGQQSGPLSLPMDYSRPGGSLKFVRRYLP